MSEDKDKNPQNVHQSIARMTSLLAAVGISKEKTMKLSSSANDKGFKFRGIDDVRNVIAPLQQECNLIIYPSIIKREAIDKKTTSVYDGKVSEKTSVWVSLEVEFEFVNSVDASSVKKIFFGEGSDNSDKSTQKAMSQAYKTMAINTFNIPTEGEADDENKIIEITTERQAGIFNNYEERDIYIKNCINALNSADTQQKLKDITELYQEKLILLQNSLEKSDREARAKVADAYLEKLNKLKTTDKKL